MSGFRRSVVLVALVAAQSGCLTRYYEPAPVPSPVAGKPLLIRPVVAVTDFQNKSGFSGSWNLGSGMADVLINQLLDTDKVVVLERKHLDDVLNELQLQDHHLFRKEGKAATGRLKTARYLVRGAVTDFTVTRDASGWFHPSGSTRFFAAGQNARVTLHAMLIDVENGQVIGSVKSTGDAGSGLFGTSYGYKDMHFGGEVFFRTPLGRATEKAMKKVVGELLDVIPREYWRPMVAETQAGRVIINGGRNAGLREGAVFRVLAQERYVTDPLTGEIIERYRGAIKGVVRVADVRDASSHAELVEGVAERGDWLEPYGDP